MFVREIVEVRCLICLLILLVFQTNKIIASVIWMKRVTPIGSSAGIEVIRQATQSRGVSCLVLGLIIKF